MQFTILLKNIFLFKMWHFQGLLFEVSESCRDKSMLTMQVFNASIFVYRWPSLFVVLILLMYFDYSHTLKLNELQGNSLFSSNLGLKQQFKYLRFEICKERIP